MPRHRFVLPVLIAAIMISACSSTTPTGPDAARARMANEATGGWMGGGGRTTNTTSADRGGYIGNGGIVAPPDSAGE